MGEEFPPLSTVWEWRDRDEGIMESGKGRDTARGVFSPEKCRGSVDFDSGNNSLVTFCTGSNGFL